MEVAAASDAGNDRDSLDGHVDEHVETSSQISDDEEWEIYRKMPNPPSFTFYEYGFHGIADSLHQFADTFQHLGQSLSDSLHRMHESYDKLSSEYSRNQAKKRTKSPQKRSSENIFDIREYQRTLERSKLRTGTSIARFRPQEGRWDGSFYVTKEVQDQLYRTPCRDPTGKLIFSLARDEAKGVKPWITPQPNQDIPEPSFASCSSSYQKMVLRYIDEVIAKVEREYKAMPENTQDRSTLKAKVGADLDNFRRKREELRGDIARKEEEEKRGTRRLV